MTDDQMLTTADIIRTELGIAVNKILKQLSEAFPPDTRAFDTTCKKMQPSSIERMHSDKLELDLNIWHGRCPVCGNFVYYPDNYCSECSQALDWISVKVILAREKSNDDEEEVINDGSQSNISTREISENYSTGHQR